MTAWITANVAKALAILAVVALLVGLLVLHECSSAHTASTTTKLATGQAGASTETGRDAVEMIGNQAAAEANSDAITRENDADIRKADGASVVVAPGVANAGISALCRRVVYQNDPRCRGAQ